MDAMSRASNSSTLPSEIIKIKMEIINYSALDDLQENEQVELEEGMVEGYKCLTFHYTKTQPFIFEGGIRTITNKECFTYTERKYPVLDIGDALNWIRWKTDSDIQTANN